MNETLRTVDGRSVLRMERRLAHPPEKVWRALTEPDRLADWFPSSVRVDLRVGGEITFDFPPDTPGVVTELDPPRVFAYTWNGDLLHWEVQPAAGGSLLVLNHTFNDHYGAPSFAAGWETCLSAMDASLAGDPAPAAEDMSERLEGYITAFGLDKGVDDGSGVRFERQLSRPIPQAWAVLGGGQADDPVSDQVPPGFTVKDFPPAAPVEMKAPHLLEYGTPSGRVRWELRDGTGQGARLVLTHTCPPEDRARALAAWRHHLQELGQRLLHTPETPRGSA
jgi:uncharacterized protein YndB with AHSA1/START domain